MHRISFVSLGFPRVPPDATVRGAAGFVSVSLAVLVMLLSGSAAAQSIGCVPNTPSYPCAYVANASADSVSVLDNNNNVLTTVLLAEGAGPNGLAITPDNSTVYVADVANGTASVIDTGTNTVTTTITLSGNPSAIAITPNGRFAYITEPGVVGQLPSFVDVIDTSNNTVTATITAVTFPTGIAITPDGKFAYVADQCASSSTACVDVINLTTNQVTSTIPLAGTAASQFSNSIAITADGSLVFVSSVDSSSDVEIYEIATSSNSLVGTSLDIGAFVPSNFGFAIAPNGILYAAFPNGSDSQTEDTVYAVTTSTNTLFSAITVGNDPSGLAVGHSGGIVYVTNSNDGTVSIIATGNNSVSSPITVGAFPDGVVAMRVSSIPLINQPLVPSARPAGGSGFTLTVNGTGFVSGSVVKWNATALTTTFVNSGQLNATVPAGDIASAGTASISVTNSSPGGGKSNAVPFSVTSPTTALTFAALTDTVGTSPGNVVVADFNNDGKADLAVINQNQTNACYNFGGAGTISILLGNGDGTFSAAATFCLADSQETVGTAPLVAGDFNGDGKIDLAASYITQGVADLEIFLGNGDGTFTAGEAALGSFSSIGTLITGDFNGDGKLDLAAPVDEDGGPFVAVFLGDGQGNFNTTSLSSTPSPFGTSLATGDFNKDGILDLAVAGSGSGGVTILLGNGDGTFTVSSQPLTSLVTPQSITAGDFDGDGNLDLAIADSSNGILTVLLGNGDGTFTVKSGEPVASQPLVFVSTADFNGDGKLDLALVGSGGLVFVDLGNGNGLFQASTGFSAGNGPVASAFADFNSDGRLDLAAANSTDNTVSILEQSPVVSPSAPNLSFGDQIINTTSTSQNVVFTNSGSAPLSFGPIAISAGFAQTNDCPTAGLSLILVAGASCTFTVNFTPASLGPAEGTLDLGISLPAPSITSVLLTGNGTAAAPQITVQPVSQTINSGLTATLTVTATGTAPLAYQWFLGLSGDTSNPITGATNSSFTTPALLATTSYWVQVSNAGGTKNSDTATITVASTLAPTCAKLVIGPGSGALQITFTATCSASTVATSINWGDDSALTTGSSATVSSTHTYAAGGTYLLTLTATDSLGQTGASAFAQLTLVSPQASPPVFAGQSSDTPLMLTAPPNSTNNPVVKFECVAATVSGGTAQLTVDLGISCASDPPTLTLTDVPQAVTIGIQTTGNTAALRSPASRHAAPFYALCMPLPGLIFLGLCTSGCAGRKRLLRYLAMGLLTCLLVFGVSCGGGFTPPPGSPLGSGKHATPAGKYFVSVVNVPAQGAAPTGFVQTSLIVPLTVTGQ
ncbi:MAG: FG-GAP-like repeat-containing protein [Terriglobales bacterium]